MQTFVPLNLPLGPVMLDVDGLELTTLDITRLQHPLVGGVILFARNFESKAQVQSLITHIKSLRSPQLLIAVDQEGGRVQRFREGFTRLPAAAEFGQLWERDSHQAQIAAYRSARTMASELREVGVDFSFAPVFDINSTANDVIGDRSFHPDPIIATQLLASYIDGMHSEGMIAVAKHFPGHGGVGGDSHHVLPCDARELGALTHHDLIPYQELVHEFDAVMTAHILYEHCDSEIPTYSRYWIDEVLRQKLGFEGVVFSDDLAMQGAIDAQQAPSIVARAQRALDAGCEMLLVCNRPDLCDELLANLAFISTEQQSAKLRRLSSI